MDLIPLPSKIILMTQSNELNRDEKGELIEASDSQNEIPMNKYKF